MKIASHRIAKWVSKVKAVKAKKHACHKRLEKVLVRAVVIKAHIRKDVAKAKAKRVARLESRYVRAKVHLRRVVHEGHKHKIVHYRKKVA